ncbi:SDR family oxidoreductase [Colwellia sp. MB02u-10]|uniref:SDR family NAD(P)-dependent oxidoreductase n=1 Tax=Colwellia sp. MB02u-10 TaxID=2759828 RepID=UPI0015F61516|nr:SDR family oxidoreductase [Colwellia sp. MB02u-10]MBA6342128.1 SDR family oxidoreductase [Colwellia sp. MB02u-10]
MNIALVGSSSLLSRCLIKDLSSEYITTYGRQNADIIFDAENIETEIIESLFDLDYDVYVFNLGYLQPKRIKDQSSSNIIKSLSINALFTIKSCEYIFDNNPKARIFIIGSESGKKGSFDTSYFLAKSMLRSYTKERKLSFEDQQLLLVSPSTIEDGKMTSSRSDTETLETYKQIHPKRRFLDSSEVSQLLFDLIKNPSTYLCNTEIELNGGKFSRMSY